MNGALDHGLAILGILAASAVVLFGTRRLVSALPLQPALRVRLRRALPLLDTAVLFVALVAIVVRVLGARPDLLPFALAAVVALFVAVAWPALRDIAHGTILRAETPFEPDDRVQAGVVDGHVRTVGLRALEVETEDGRRVRVPWSHLAVLPYGRSSRADPVHAHTFTVEMAKSRRPAEHVTALRAAALNSFYASTREEPRVRLLEERERTLTCEVTVFSADPSFLPELEAAVRRRAGDR